MKLNVCDVSHTYISVPTLIHEGHYTHFGADLYMEFNIDNGTQRVEFENASDHYVFKPLRIVQFEETRHIYNYDQEIPPYALFAISRVKMNVDKRIILPVANFTTFLRSTFF